MPLRVFIGKEVSQPPTILGHRLTSYYTRNTKILRCNLRAQPCRIFAYLEQVKNDVDREAYIQTDIILISTYASTMFTPVSLLQRSAGAYMAHKEGDRQKSCCSSGKQCSA